MTPIRDGIVDRGYFANWISGFTDGEGCFVLRMDAKAKASKIPIPAAHFAIALRSDDLAILEMIRSFFGCGGISFKRNKRGFVGKSFAINRIADLHEIVVPHFEEYPLLAKKRNDFLIWKSGVNLIRSVNIRPQQYRTGTKGSRVSKWRPEERALFAELHDRLRAIRKDPRTRQ